jgi:hypothetical protein
VSKVNDEILGRVVVLMVTLQSKADVIKVCREKLNLTERATKDAIERASGVIAEAAVFNRDIEAGKSLMRYNDLYERSLRVMDTKTAIMAEDKRCRLLGLYKKNKIEVKDEIDRDRVENARLYLESLGLTPEGLPIDELARVISIEVTEKMSAKYAIQGLRKNEAESKGTDSEDFAARAGHWNVTANSESDAEGEDEEFFI